MEKVTDTHVYFWMGEFSNKYAHKFNYKGNIFEHVEQAFMWEKANFFNDEKTAALILKQNSPKVIFKLGKMVQCYDESKWNQVREEYMYMINLSKWESSEGLKKLMVETYPKKIVYADPYNSIWGVGLGPKNPMILNESDWNGTNLLGKVLTKVRERLLNNY